jgi:hypothetical protein
MNARKSSTASSSRSGHQRLILSLLTVLPALLLNALAYQVPTSGTAWTGTGPYIKSMASGLQVRVSLTGATGMRALNDTSQLMGSNTTVPQLAASTNGLQIQTAVDSCQTSFSSSTTCTGLGTVTINFTDASGNAIKVRNPKLHISRIGGFSGSLAFGANLTLTTTGVTMGSPATGAKNLTVASSKFSPTSANGATACATSGASSGCGTIPFTGTTSTLAFNVGADRASVSVAWDNGASSASPNLDAYFITVTADEDFGDAPASFDPTQAASHIVGDLMLGSSVDPENLSTLASATSPNAVAAAANNNGTNGDGAEEDAISSFPGLYTNSSSYSLSVPISGASQAGRVCGWIDFNRDGVFAAATFERTCSSFAANASSVTLNWTGISGLSAGSNYLRLRAAYAAADFNPTGQQNSGEVEDYQLTITAPPALVSVTGTVWNDNDASISINGSPLETGTDAGGLTVYAVDGSGKVVDKATVAANGTYTLSSMPANSSLTLRLSTDPSIAVGSIPALLAPSLPSGWVNTGENLNGTSETITPGEIALTTTTANLSSQDFGIAQPSVSATVWIDLNRNGVRDNGEAIWDSSSANLTLYLTDANNVVIAKGTLQADGSLNFFGIAAGTYTLLVSADPSVAIGSQAPAPSLPSGWGTTGENTGNPATGTLDGTPDTKITVVIP